LLYQAHRVRRAARRILTIGVTHPSPHPSVIWRSYRLASTVHKSFVERDRRETRTFRTKPLLSTSAAATTRKSHLLVSSSGITTHTILCRCLAASQEEQQALPRLSVDHWAAAVRWRRIWRRPVPALVEGHGHLRAPSENERGEFQIPTLSLHFGEYTRDCHHRRTRGRSSGRISLLTRRQADGASSGSVYGQSSSAGRSTALLSESCGISNDSNARMERNEPSHTPVLLRRSFGRLVRLVHHLTILAYTYTSTNMLL
jgi:hypothetical protein